jgi:hypothetical protein
VGRVATAATTDSKMRTFPIVQLVQTLGFPDMFYFIIIKETLESFKNDSKIELMGI